MLYHCIEFNYIDLLLCVKDAVYEDVCSVDSCRHLPPNPCMKAQKEGRSSSRTMTLRGKLKIRPSPKKENVIWTNPPFFQSKLAVRFGTVSWINGCFLDSLYRWWVARTRLLLIPPSYTLISMSVSSGAPCATQIPSARSWTRKRLGFTLWVLTGVWPQELWKEPRKMTGSFMPP